MVAPFFMAQFYSKFYRRIRYLMGSPFEITAYGEAAVCLSGLDAAFKEIDRIDRLISIFRPESQIALINRLSQRGFFPMGPELLHLISSAIDYSQISQGAFDITSGPLVDMWGFGIPGERGVPSHEEISAALPHGGSQYLRVHQGGLEFLRDGMKLNFGGIGKGYAVDRAVDRLKEYGIQCGMVHCGSATFCLGAPPGEGGWRVAVRDPRGERGDIGTVLLCDQAIATSGDYEKCFYDGGRRVSHLIDPRTGYPASGTASVSIIAGSAMEADALSTAFFILNEGERRKVFDAFPRMEGLIVEEDGFGKRVFSPTPAWSEKWHGQSRRRFLALAALALATLIFPLPLRARATTVYLTEDEALYAMMPGADRFDTEEIGLSPNQLSKAEALAGKRFLESRFRFRVGRTGEEAIGYAMVLDVIGKERPITFLIGISPEGAIMGIEVLIYRESEGSEVRHRRFMGQFLKKKKDDPLRLGQDIQPISGATLSSRAAAYAVKKALSIFEVVYQKGNPG